MCARACVCFFVYVCVFVCSLVCLGYFVCAYVRLRGIAAEVGVPCARILVSFPFVKAAQVGQEEFPVAAGNCELHARESEAACLHHAHDQLSSSSLRENNLHQQQKFLDDKPGGRICPY